MLYKHAANYALRLSSRGGRGMRTYVADLEEPEEDEMADEEEPEEGEAAEPEAEEEEEASDGIPEPGEPRYDDMFFRYVSVAAEKGDDQDWLVGKKLERGTGVSFALVDNAPKAPWIDVPNAMTHRGPPREPREGEEPADPEAPPEPTRVHFAGGFLRRVLRRAHRAGHGEVAGMLCADTVNPARRRRARTRRRTRISCARWPGRRRRRTPPPPPRAPAGSGGRSGRDRRDAGRRGGA